MKEYGISYREIRATWTVRAMFHFQRRIRARYQGQEAPHVRVTSEASWKRQFQEAKAQGRVNVMTRRQR